jgi:hypothetical protein
MPQPKKAAPEDDGAGLREQLQRLLNPLDVVVLSRERLQEVVDDAVKRGRLTRSDAAELVAEIRRTTEEWLGGARRATGLGGASFPIQGYETLTAAQVQSRLGDLTPADLRKVRDYERRNANRKTVLAAIESRLG